jgi:uncharacterized protein YjeT (DUF2065 family)
LATPEKQLNKLLHRERWRLVGLCCVVLGALILFAAIATLGFGGITNPKNATSIFPTFAFAGLLRSFALPLTISGIGAVIVGIVVIAVNSDKSDES